MRRPLSLAVTVLLALLVADTVQAQILGRIRDRVESTVERELEDRSERAAERAVEALFEAGEDAVRCLFTDAECIRRASESGQDVVLTNDEGRPVDRTGAPVSEDNPEDAVVRAEASAAAAGPAPPGEGVWANYDFVPGARVLFADDFADEYVGNFPSRLTYARGNMEVVEWEGRMFLRGTGTDEFSIPVGEALPDRFTLEFDIHDPATESGTSVYFSGEDPDDYEGPYVTIGSWRGSGLWSTDEGPLSTNPIEDIEEAVIPIRIAVDGRYVKVYAREQRIANVPQADLGRGDAVTFTLATRADRPIYIGDIRLAAGGREVLYDALQAEGRVATRGVLFTTGSADLRPESTPTLLDMVRMLERHPEVRLRIEGHTDSQGSPPTNLDLSRRRAEAVVAFLTGRGVAPARLEAAGLGDTRPAADNATPEGRQQNRRVELVLL